MDNIPSNFIIGVIICVGFFFGGLATKLKLPKITGYIIAGVILNPHLFHFVPPDFAKNTNPVTNIALSLITFSIGGTLFFPKMKKMGKDIFYITFFESEFAFLAVFIGSCLIMPFFIHRGQSWATVFIPLSLLLAVLAAPTDPSATLAVVHQYKAKGIVTSTTMGVSAFDDVFGIINYSIAMVLASALVGGGSLGVSSLVFRPAFIIGGAVFLGIVFGTIFNLLSPFVKEGAESVLIVLVLGLLSLSFGLAKIIGVDELLTTMVMGIVVINLNRYHDKVFSILERYTEQLVFLIFFTISGMFLDFSTFMESMVLVVLFFIFRTSGKAAGVKLGGLLSGADYKVKKYTSFGLIPQGGLVVGLALIMKENHLFDYFSGLIINIIIGSTIVHEFIGPILVKYAFKKAGEIT
ncbi:MAG: hypothetical protein B1H08_05375 [Candidatus Omnitrophica bacterium 4484_171]|nr:MAG: hypothetical protein B1H08_05375 [Candidatus Omnitrophica bacterium 4484_171]